MTYELWAYADVTSMGIVRAIVIGQLEVASVDQHHASIRGSQVINSCSLEPCNIPLASLCNP
jgi:hypothetical protein